MKQLVELFKALADESRLRILNLLVNAGELCVCDIQKILRFSQPKVSRHLTYLKHAGLVRDRREGMWVVYSFVGLQDESRRRLMKELKDVFDLNLRLREDIGLLRQAIRVGTCKTYCVIYPDRFPDVIRPRKGTRRDRRRSK
jgi:ArsR family transcriptional regulator